MKLNENFLRHTIKHETMLIPTAGAQFHGLVQGNKTLDFILLCLQNDTTEEKIVEAMSQKYDGNISDIREDVAKAVSQLKKIGAIDE